MCQTPTVGRYLVDRLSQLGLEHLFSIAGDYSIEWITKYVEPSDITLVQEVSELSAGYAADGYARLKGIGALCVTYSAGALSAVNQIAGAYVERVPIVLINGTPSIARTLAFEQTGFSSHHFITGRETDMQSFEHVTVATVRLENPDRAPGQIDDALRQCITERRPVYIELLEDVVDLPCIAAPEEPLRPARTRSDPDNLSTSLKRITEALGQAKKPLLWIGVEVDRFGLQAKTETLIRQFGAPYATQLLSKAVLSEDDRQFVGVFDGKASSEAVQALVDEADFILALGVWLTDINTLGEPQGLDKAAFVSLDTVKFGTFFSAQIALEDAIDGLLASGSKSAWPIGSAPSVAVPPPRGGREPITYQGFYDHIASAIGDGTIRGDTIFGSDASMNYFGSLLLRVGAPRGYIAQSSYSSIGYIGPAATGLCLAKRSDQAVMVFSGDGGFQMSAQCLSTQTRFKLNPIIFVIDNGVYAVEQWLGNAAVFESNQPFYASCLLHRWNYSKLADVFGCKGFKVSTYDELKAALAEAMSNTDSPSLIQVVVDSKSIPQNATWKKK